jgi:Putative ER transporter, 6TM, N-terminal
MQPSTISAIFLFAATATILYMRARLGPGPFAPATAFSCICVDICLTVAPLYPYPNYSIGKTVVLPIAFHAGVSLAASVLIFPESVNAQFVKRLKAVLEPIASGIKAQNELLATSPLTKSFDPEPFTAKISVAESRLTPLAASARLVKRDISWGRLGGRWIRGISWGLTSE